MAIYKNNNGTWYVMIRYQDWTGARKQKCKRGFATRKEAADWELQFKLQKKASLDKYQKLKQKYNGIQKALDDMRKENHKLAEEKNIMQDVSDRYDRVVRVLGLETVEAAIQQDIRNEKALEEKQRMEQMPKGSIHKRLAWGVKKSEMENQQRKKNKSKNREMER